MITKSVTKDRIIISVNINDKEAHMLVDTGASIGIVDIDCMKEYGFKKGVKLEGQIVGVGGESSSAYHTKDLQVDIEGVKLYQFITMDIDTIKKSIRENTGVTIQGIIGLTQIKMSEMKIDADNGIIKIGY